MVYHVMSRRMMMSEEFGRIASALERIADALERKWHIDIDHGHIEHIDAIDHAHIDDIGEIHGDVVTHPKKF